MYARTHAKAATDPKSSHLVPGRNLAGKDSRLAPQHEIQPLPERERDPAESSTPAAGNRPLAGFSFGNLAIGPTERLGVQTKLTVGQPNDRYEQEADRVADQVMRMPDPNQIATSVSEPPSIQRLCPECEEDLQRQSQSVTEEDEKKKKRLQTKPLISSIPLNLQRQVVPTSEEDEKKKKHLQKKPSSGANLEVSPDLQERIGGLHGGGHPLSTSERAFLEPRFGYDFSQVRLHTDERAAEMARSVNARAFTLGRDVVFGTGEYQPRSTEGQQLLAHELTHVVQQNTATSEAGIQRLADPACSDKANSLPMSDSCSDYTNTCYSQAFTAAAGTTVTINVVVNYAKPDDCSFPVDKEDFRVELYQCGWFNTTVKDFGTKSIGAMMTDTAKLPGAGIVVGNDNYYLRVHSRSKCSLKASMSVI